MLGYYWNGSYKKKIIIYILTIINYDTLKYLTPYYDRFACMRGKSK